MTLSGAGFRQEHVHFPLPFQQGQLAQLQKIILPQRIEDGASERENACMHALPISSASLLHAVKSSTSTQIPKPAISAPNGHVCEEMNSSSFPLSVLEELVV